MTDRNPEDTSTTEFSQICDTVVTKVAATAGVSRVELRPLYDVIDPAALERLFHRHEDTPSQPDGWVQFAYDDCRVVVSSTGTVDVSAGIDNVDSSADRNTYEWQSARTLHWSVVTAVGSTVEKEPTELEPLYAVLNPDALVDLFAPSRTRNRERDFLEVQFSYHNCLVTVTGDGRITTRQKVPKVSGPTSPRR